MPQAGAPSRYERAPRGTRPLADLVVPCIGPVLAKQGFGEADILLYWADIVGPKLARHCQPVTLQFRKGTRTDAPREPATLMIRVEGSFAVMLQHMAPTVIDRVNTHLGWRCIGRLALRQGPLVRHPDLARRMPQPDAAALSRAAEAVPPMEDDALHDALVRLGSRIFAARPRHPGAQET